MDKIKIINKFFGGTTRDDSPTTTGGDATGTNETETWVKFTSSGTFTLTSLGISNTIYLSNNF